MFYLSAQHLFSANANHLVGTDNSIVDSLSRFSHGPVISDQIATPLPPHAGKFRVSSKVFQPNSMASCSMLTYLNGQQQYSKSCTKYKSPPPP